MAVSVSAELPASAAAIWNLIGNFPLLQRWHPLVVTCTAIGSGVGAVRTIRFSDWWADEVLVRSDPATYRLGYRVTGSSRPAMIGVEADMRLTDFGGARTRLDWRSGHDDAHPEARSVDDALAAYYPARLGHLRAALGLSA